MTLNNNKQLKKDKQFEKRVWKIFLRNKAIELMLITTILLYCIFGVSFVGKIIINSGLGLADNLDMCMGKCTIDDAWGVGLIFTLLFLGFSLVVYVWIKSNWENAKDEATWETE